VSLSLLKAAPNLYAGKKVKKLINQRHTRLRKKPYRKSLIVKKSINKLIGKKLKIT